jgi:hypothetical protein
MIIMILLLELDAAAGGGVQQRTSYTCGDCWSSRIVGDVFFHGCKRIDAGITTDRFRVVSELEGVVVECHNTESTE